MLYSCGELLTLLPRLEDKELAALIYEASLQPLPPEQPTPSGPQPPPAPLPGGQQALAALDDSM